MPMIDQPAAGGWDNTSTVVTAGRPCPAPEQNNECKDCRACWNPEIECVAYRFHGSKKHGNSKMLLDIEKITSSQGYRI